MTDELMREVQDDLRRERMQQLWKRYRAPLLTVVALLVLGTAGASFWQDQQQKKAGEAMQSLAMGIEQFEGGEYTLAADQFAALAARQSGEVRDIARLWQGRALVQAGKNDAAITSLRQLAEQPAGKDLLWRDMACLRLMGLSDTVPDACARANGSPLSGQLQEWQAARLWQEGKTEQARAMLSGMRTDASASEAQRERAARLLGALGEGK